MLGLMYLVEGHQRNSYINLLCLSILNFHFKFYRTDNRLDEFGIILGLFSGLLTKKKK